MPAGDEVVDQSGWVSLSDQAQSTEQQHSELAKIFPNGILPENCEVYIPNKEEYDEFMLELAEMRKEMQEMTEEETDPATIFSTNGEKEDPFTVASSHSVSMSYTKGDPFSPQNPPLPTQGGSSLMGDFVLPSFTGNGAGPLNCLPPTLPERSTNPLDLDHSYISHLENKLKKLKNPDRVTSKTFISDIASFKDHQLFHLMTSEPSSSGFDDNFVPDAPITPNILQRKIAPQTCAINKQEKVELVKADAEQLKYDALMSELMNLDVDVTNETYPGEEPTPAVLSDDNTSS